MRTYSLTQKQVKVNNFYGHLGLGVKMYEADSCPDYLYDGRVVAIKTAEKPALMLHEPAHFLIAPKRRQHVINWGLGPADFTSENKEAEQFLTSQEQSNPAFIDQEEDASVYVNMCLALGFFGDEGFAVAWRELGGFHNEGPGRIFPQERSFRNYDEWLVKIKAQLVSRTKEYRLKGKHFEACLQRAAKQGAIVLDGLGSPLAEKFR